MLGRGGEGRLGGGGNELTDGKAGDDGVVVFGVVMTDELTLEAVVREAKTAAALVDVGNSCIERLGGRVLTALLEAILLVLLPE